MYLDPEPALIGRHFAKVEGRCVHYRRAGQGPALLLLHQSPTSSAEMASQIIHFAQHFTVIAPDTPGYGLSDPLALYQPEMEDYARALAALLDALGVEKAGLYGTHTGAMIAAEFGRRYAGRVSAVILDGYVVLEEEEQAELLARYFVDMPPAADGSHLPWYWARIRDQTIFFPWYRKEQSARMRFDVPTAAMLQPYLLDLLAADRMGTPAYAAAFRYPASEAAAQFSAPTYLLNYHADAISHHPERLGALPACAAREMLPDPQALLDRASELLKEHGAGMSQPPPAPAQPQACRYVATRHGPLLMRTSGEGPPVLLLHEPGRSSAQWRPLADGPGAGACLHAPDLPGHGASRWAGKIRLDVLLDVLEDLLDQVEGEPQIVALGASGLLGLAFKQRRPGVPLTLIDLPLGDDHLFWPDISPVDHGGHLLAAWQCARDAALFRPWHRPDLDHSLDYAFDLDPARVHEQTVEMLRAAANLSNWTRALMEVDAPTLLGAAAQPLRMAVRSGRGVEASAALAGMPAEIWPNDMSAWRDIVLAKRSTGDLPVS
jgi:pimeloyl-ACP methyl ester carboxylesterase